MSTIKTTYIQHPSAPNPNIELAADGTVVLPLSDLEDLANVGGSPTDGQVLEYDTGTSSWGPASIALPAGIGTNVVQTYSNTTFTTTSASFTDVTPLSVTITPTSASSKVLLVASVAMSNQTVASHTLVGFGRGGTAITGDLGYFYELARTDAATREGSQQVGIVYLDSPATTSATTYTVMGRVDGGTGTFNVSGNSTKTTYGSIVAIEVAA